MLKLPYGESNFSTVMKGGYFYQDRTAFIRELEAMPSYLYYLRPHGFGKSLFVSMLQHYYGLEFQSEFDQLFGNLAIGKKPTASANQYLVLKFEFSGIDTTTLENIKQGFLKSIRKGISAFLIQYNTFFPNDIQELILNKEQANDIFSKLLDYHHKISIKEKLPAIYLLIDDYDFFANELAAFNFKFFENFTTKFSFIRQFYETIKSATWTGSVSNLFLTGRLPISLDSVSSGFNIGTNISLRPSVHDMCGFNEREVRDILKGIGIKKNNVTSVLNDLRAWYGGYLFHIDAKSPVYNSYMVLYFAEKYQSEKKYPNQLLDPNMANDFKMPQNENTQLKTLDLLKTEANITRQFSLQKNINHYDLVSLLFYIGALTIRSESLGYHTFAVPNYMVQKGYKEI